MNDRPDLVRLRRTLEIALSTQLGADSSWHIYDRTRKAPMNSALDVAAGMLNQPFEVVWVDGGRPELYAFEGLERLVVVYSARFVELTAYTWRVFGLVETAPAYAERGAEQAALKIIAELLLRDGHAELALTLFARGVIGRTIVIPDIELLLELELTPIGPAYMAVWFFGLFHELGHAAPLVERESGRFSLADIEIELIGALTAFGFEELGVQRIMRELGSTQANPLAPTHVRRELSADVFATRALFAATKSIMLEQDEPYDSTELVDLVFRSLAAVWFLGRCEATAMLLARGQTREGLLRMAVHPVTYTPRLGAVRNLLATAMAGNDPDDEFLREVDEVLDETTSRYAALTATVDNGFGAALRFAFDAKPISEKELAALAVSVQREPLATLEAKAFCGRARSLGIDAPALARLDEILEELPGLEDLGQGTVQGRQRDTTS